MVKIYQQKPVAVKQILVIFLSVIISGSQPVDMVAKYSKNIFSYGWAKMREAILAGIKWNFGQEVTEVIRSPRFAAI